MSRRAPANPDKFREASAWFRGRVAVTKSEWDAMTTAARRQAFTVAGTEQLRVVQTVLESIQSAIDKGTPLEQWQRSIKRKLGEYATANAANLRTAFHTANQQAYSNGRWAQLNDPSVLQAMPYWMLDVVLDSRTSQICTELAGTILPASHPWWLTHWNPFHFWCRTTVRALTESMAKRRGGVTEQPPRPNIGDDWGLAPPLRAGSTWEPKREDFDPSAWVIYQRNQERMRLKRQKPANDNSGQ